MLREHRNEAFALLAGVGIGAAVMYFLDPRRGNARRAQVVERTSGAIRSATHDMEIRRRDLRNRARGVAAELGASIRHKRVDDDVLTERVRAEIGHHADSLRHLEVHSAAGRVTLHGEVAPDDHAEVIRSALHVRGVRGVDDQLVERSQ